MGFLNSLVYNVVFMAAATGWFVAQILKTIIYALINKTFDAERLVGSGGMPSSHSATVCALATAAGIQYGGGSFQFAVSAILAIIVMYDARGVRRETGIQAQVINEMISFFSNVYPASECVSVNPYSSPSIPLMISFPLDAGLNCVAPSSVADFPVT